MCRKTETKSKNTEEVKRWRDKEIEVKKLKKGRREIEDKKERKN